MFLIIATLAERRDIYRKDRALRALSLSVSILVTPNTHVHFPYASHTHTHTQQLPPLWMCCVSRSMWQMHKERLLGNVWENQLNITTDISRCTMSGVIHYPLRPDPVSLWTLMDLQLNDSVLSSVSQNTQEPASFTSHSETRSHHLDSPPALCLVKGLRLTEICWITETGKAVKHLFLCLTNPAPDHVHLLWWETTLFIIYDAMTCTFV